MAAVTASSTVTESMGSKVLKIFTLSGVNDADTFDSGLGDRVFRYWISQTDNPTTQASAGISAAESSGTFTFYPGEDGASFDLFVMVSGA